MLSAEIQKAYYDSPDHGVLNEVSLQWKLGELTVLLGVNGCGKSTLLKCLAGLHQDLQGSVQLEGKPLEAWSLGERARRLAYLPQSVTPGFSFTAEEVILLSRYHTGAADTDSERSERLQLAAESMDVTPLLQRHVDELSGGEWQRVAIARTVMQDAQFLLLDEPTAHLDLSHRLALFRQCRKWADTGKGILCATHDLDAALEYADRILVLHGGRVAADGSAEDVVTGTMIQRVFGERNVEVMKNPLTSRPQLVLDSREQKEQRERS